MFMPLDWNAIINTLKSFGVKDGIFILFFFLAHFWIYKLYLGRLNDRKEEIQRLATDNHEYRDRLLSLLDTHFGYDSKKQEGIEP